MGNSQSFNVNAPLLPCNPPVAAVDPRFIAQRETTLLLKEKIMSFSGDDFSIKEVQTGQPYFKVDGRNFSLRQKKQFLDAYGVPVFNMKKKLLKLVSTQNIYKADSSDEKLFVIESTFTFMKPKIFVVFNDLVTGEQCEVGLKGNWIARQCVLWIDRGRRGKDNQQIIGYIHSEWAEARNLLFDKQTYFLRIAPGVDMALMVAICVALDEKAHENQNSAI
ncbi:tubby C-terminal-like domain-containing protein [Geranomyces variabilis]|nr:tubby C-terminal-like domain-containing protein [Geranomyces variabilis]KAJ3136953.1 hypothetical protein HDU90_002519 [Geranomyces variabilis]